MVQLASDFSFSLREGKGDKGPDDTTRLPSSAVAIRAAEREAYEPCTQSRVKAPFSGMRGSALPSSSGKKKKMAQKGKLASH